MSSEANGTEGSGSGSGSESFDAAAQSLQQQIEEQLAELAVREQRAASAAEHGVACSPDEEGEEEENYPSAILPPSTPELAQLGDLWSRFLRWVESQGASSALRMNEAASCRDFFLLQSSLSQGDSCFELPVDLAASFAHHDGQCWSSVTGVMGRWYLLDAAAVFAEWRDQVDMAEMGLYSGAKYSKARKAFGSHERIDTSTWFNPRWIPIVCSRGRNLGGDLICIDMAPIRAAHRGQVILYLTESAERFVLADSFAQWMDNIVRHLEAGVYRFDSARATYVAGTHPDDKATGADAATSAATPAAASSSASAPRTPAAPSSRIGVEAFMFSALEARDFFIANRTEEMVFLADNDFALLTVGDDISATGSAAETKDT